MTAKRLLVGLVAFGLAVRGLVAAELAPIVRAQEPPPIVMPHGGYDQDTELCAVCHDWHADIDTSTDPEQLLAFPWEQLLTRPSELELCFSCHDGTVDPDANVESDFRDPDRKSFHPVLAPADDILLACSDCHAQHQDPDEDVKLLYREMSPGEYLPFADPIGDTFCYGCHGDDTLSALPAAFENSIHDGNDKGTGGVEPPTPGTDLKCSACHEPHASDYRYLTRANEEKLCYQCHSSAANSANGSNPQAAFSVANDYVDDADGIRIYHHPVSDEDQVAGDRAVECASCHNSHTVTHVETASDPSRARAMDSGWAFNWDAASGDYYRSQNAAEYCGKCHANPEETAPLEASVNVPYDVNLVNDSGNDADGLPHDQFDLDWYLGTVPYGKDPQDGSPHGYADYVFLPSSGEPSYPGCPPDGDCELACTACHDFHGSTNAYMLREDISSPDYRPLEVISAVWEAGTATLTVAEPHVIPIGWPVIVSGMNPDQYDGTRPVTATTATTISFELPLAVDPGDGSDGALETRGPYNRSSTALIIGFDGLNSDRSELQTFCLTCHLEQSPTHGLVDAGGEPTLCTSCHNHSPTSDDPF